jgi:hypothetical protein
VSSLALFVYPSVLLLLPSFTSPQVFLAIFISDTLSTLVSYIVICLALCKN